MMPLCENKIAMMERRLQECEIAAVGLDGVAEQQYRSRVQPLSKMRVTNRSVSMR